MEWFKSLFSRKTPERVFPIVDIKVNISEPVISFVETFKANPKRFRIVETKLDEVSLSLPVSTFKRYKLIDKYEKLSWEFTAITNYSFSDSRSYVCKYEGPYFLSSEEVEYISRVLYPYFYGRVDNYIKALGHRQREALKKVYCRGSI